MVGGMITRKEKMYRRMFLLELDLLRACQSCRKPHEVTSEYLAFYLNELGGLGSAW